MNSISEIFSAGELSFLRMALLFGILAAPALGIVGTLTVTRRISSLAGASAHAALGGIGIALYLQRVWHVAFLSPLVGALFGALGAALLVGYISLHGKEREDTAIGVVWALGMAIGLLFLNRTPGYVDWQGYLFGNILMLSARDFPPMIALDIAIILPTVIFYRQILAFSFDEVFAELRGVKTSLIYLVILAMTALTIVLLINLVGIILVIALLTLPAAIAGLFSRHLYSTMITSGILAAVFVISGVVISFAFDLPTGPVIVVEAGIVYLFTPLLHRKRK